MPQSSTRERSTFTAPYGAPHVFVLAVIEGEDAASVHRIGTAESTIGRGDAAQFEIDDPEVSTHHCLLRVAGPVCLLVDLDSRNGTFLNGQRLRAGLASRVRHLDEIQVGATRMLLLTARFKETSRVKS